MIYFIGRVLLDDLSIPVGVVATAVVSAVVLIIGGLIKKMIDTMDGKISKLENGHEELRNTIDDNRESRDEQIGEIKDQIHSIGEKLMDKVTELAISVAKLGAK